MIHFFCYIRGDQVEDYREQGWTVRFLRYYGMDSMCFLAELKIEEEDD